MTQKADIFAAADKVVEAVAIPEWNATLHVRNFSGRLRDKLDRFISARCDASGKLVDPSGVKVMTVICGACDMDGLPIFTEADAEALADKSDAAISRLFQAIQRLNRLGGVAMDGEKKDC